MSYIIFFSIHTTTLSSLPSRLMQFQSRFFHSASSLLHYYVFLNLLSISVLLLLRLRQQHKNILNAKANAKVGFISVVTAVSSDTFNCLFYFIIDHSSSSISSFIITYKMTNLWTKEGVIKCDDASLNEHLCKNTAAFQIKMWNLCSKITDCVIVIAVIVISI